jgi:hypothetical protein
MLQLEELDASLRVRVSKGLYFGFETEVCVGFTVNFIPSAPLLSFAGTASI